MTQTTSSKKIIIVNALANWTGTIAQMVLVLVVSPILVHGLGDRRYGVWAFVDSILAYLTLLDLGVAASVVRYVARFEAVKDQEGLNRTFNTSLAIFAAAGLAVLGIAGVLLGPAWPLLRVPADLDRETWWLLALLALNLALLLPLGVFPSALDGLQRYVPKVAVRTAAAMLQAGLSVVIIRGGGGLISLAILITTCNVVSHLALAVLSFLYLPALRFSTQLVDGPTFRMIRGYSVDAFFAMLAGRISFQTDALVIGTFLAPEQITYFVIGARLVEYSKNMVRSLTGVLTPSVSQRQALGDSEGIRRILIDGTRMVVWIVVPVQIGFWVLGKPFLALWMGPDYAERSFPILAILSLPLTLTLSQSISGRILYGIGRLRFFTMMVLIEAAGNLLASVVLVHSWGISGVAWGTAVPNLVFNLALAYYVCEVLGFGLRDYLLRSFVRPLSLAPMLGLTWLLCVWAIPQPSWLALISIGAVGLAVYGPCAALAEFGRQRVADVLRSVVGRPVVGRWFPSRNATPKGAGDHDRGVGSTPFLTVKPRV